MGVTYKNFIKVRLKEFKIGNIILKNFNKSGDAGIFSPDLFNLIKKSFLEEEDPGPFIIIKDKEKGFFKRSFVGNSPFYFKEIKNGDLEVFIGEGDERYFKFLSWALENINNFYDLEISPDISYSIKNIPEKIYFDRFRIAQNISGKIGYESTKFISLDKEEILKFINLKEKFDLDYIKMEVSFVRSEIGIWFSFLKRGESIDFPLETKNLFSKFKKSFEFYLIRSVLSGYYKVPISFNFILEYFKKGKGRN